MRRSESLAELIRQSSELVQESGNLRRRAKEAIHNSSVVINRSKELLSSRSIDGVPEVSALVMGVSAQTEPEAVPVGTSLSEPQPPTSQAEATLERVADRDFQGETVFLDGRHFVDCTLSRCVLEYSGGPCILEGTHFTECRFLFGNEAAMTVAMLECFGLVEEHVARAILPPPGITAAKSRVN